MIVITYGNNTHTHSVYTIARKKTEFKSNINKWNNKTIEIGCFDIEKTCAYWELRKREENTGRQSKRINKIEKDYLKWPDKNMLALAFDSKIKKKITYSIVCIVHIWLYGSGSKTQNI